MRRRQRWAGSSPGLLAAGRRGGEMKAQVVPRAEENWISQQRNLGKAGKNHTGGFFFFSFSLFLSSLPAAHKPTKRSIWDLAKVASINKTEQWLFFFVCPSLGDQRRAHPPEDILPSRGQPHSGGPARNHQGNAGRNSG